MKLTWAAADTSHGQIQQLTEWKHNVIQVKKINEITTDAIVRMTKGMN